MAAYGSITITQDDSSPAPQVQPEGFRILGGHNGHRTKKFGKPDKSSKRMSYGGVKKNTKRPKSRAGSGKEETRTAGRLATDVLSDKEPLEDFTGSPWDPTERTSLKFEALDLQRSYVDDYKKAMSTFKEKGEKTRPPQRRPVWDYKGKRPLTDISELIKMGWDTREPDLDPTDLQGQIQRCNQRIQENIMPSFFEERLKRLEAESSALLKVQQSESQNLSKDAIQRIAYLRNTETALEEKGITSQVVNVRAIIAAYRNKALDWTTGLVTYWSEGRQLSQPRPFNWDEFEAINDYCSRSESFWVEGLFGVGNRSANSCLTAPATPFDESTNFYNIALRIPGREWWTELEFLYDTGSADMYIFKQDIDLITGPERDQVRVLLTDEYGSIGGKVMTPVIQLEGTILDSSGRRMAPWFRVPCRVDMRDIDQEVSSRGSPGSRDNPRLDGGVFRKYYYYMTSPDSENTMKIAASRHNLLPMVRGLKKETRRAVIDLMMQYPLDRGVPPQYVTPTPLGDEEKAQLKKNARLPPREEPKFFDFGRGVGN